MTETQLDTLTANGGAVSSDALGRMPVDARLREHPHSSAAPSRRGPIHRDAIFRRMLAVADVCAAVGGLALTGALGGVGFASASVISLPMIVLIAKMTGRYDHDEVVLRKSTLDEIPSLLALAGGYALAWSLVAFVADLHTGLGGGGVIVLWAATSVLLMALRGAARAMAHLTARQERVLIIGSDAERRRLAHSLACDPGAHISVVGFLPLEDERHSEEDWGVKSRRRRTLTFDDLPSLVQELDVERVFLVARADSERMLDAVRRTIRTGVKVSIVPRLLEVVGSSVEFDTVGGVTLFGLRRPGLARSSRAVKRAMDVVGSALAIGCLAPLWAIVVLAIKLDSPGPIFFLQRRVGRDGRTFQLIKFRTMVDGAEAQRSALENLNESHGIFKMSTDPRVTRVGRWLRRTSVDELPQLINVLRGEMSLVGPRPLVLDEDCLVEGPHRERLSLSPGMTGPWQVLGPSRPPLAEMVKTDYLYAANWSLWTDVKLLLRTLAHVAQQRGV